ncbi:hypothetical protein A6770_00410 [Nostoc minutum NIES-26]|uniref:Uncharacterized protein n=1 Tax=Nostoc minutum NIES-26 TaxID=1844469 RepID=A0A367QY70_9NOSO|nr:hypothetical protein A6770_00410 [Nostoc minutum NIES-26]
MGKALENLGVKVILLAALRAYACSNGAHIRTEARLGYVISEMKDWVCFQPEKLQKLDNSFFPPEGFALSRPITVCIFSGLILFAIF